MREEEVKEDLKEEEDTRTQEECESETDVEEEKAEKADPKDAQIADLKDRVQRQMAEFDNFRKRTAREKSQMFDMGAKSVIEKILPVIDNFERAIESIPEEEIDNPFIEGLNQIYKQLNQTLLDMDVKPISAVGCTFDPDFHDAVMHGEDEAFGENEISDEFEKGYTYKDSVVRHSKVRVMN